MNASEISKTPGARLKRIKIVSRIVRFTVWGIFVFFIYNVFLFRLFRISSPFHLGFSLRDADSILSGILLCVWYWKLAKLFHLYEQGLIFAAGTIRCIKTLGILCVINWLLTAVSHFFLAPPPPYIPKTLPPGVTVSAPVEFARLGFFSFSVYSFNLSLLLAGIVIVVIAWIMDEGRKIQEEQELTV